MARIKPLTYADYETHAAKKRTNLLISNGDEESRRPMANIIFLSYTNFETDAAKNGRILNNNNETVILVAFHSLLVAL
jgi:hypothetical protein